MIINYRVTLWQFCKYRAGTTNALLKLLTCLQTRFLIICFAMICWPMTGTASSTDNKELPPVTLKIHVTTLLPPYFYLDKNCAPRGILPDLMATTNKYTDYKFEWIHGENSNPDEADYVIKTKFSDKKWEKDNGLFIDSVQLGYLKKFGSEDYSMAQWEDLEGLKLAIRPNHSITDYLKSKGIKVALIPDVPSSLLAVEENIVDGVFGPKAPLIFYYKKMDLTTEMSFIEIERLDAYFVRTKKLEVTPRLNQFERTFSTLTQKGFQNILMNQYLAEATLIQLQQCEMF